MLNDDNIIQIFKEAVREVDTSAKLDDITTTTELSKMGLDSVMTMEVIGVLEEKLDLRFPDEDLATLKSINDLALMVRRVSA